MKIGIGITTYNRPDYLKQCLESLLKNITSLDCLYIYNDGSTVSYQEVYDWLDEQRFDLDEFSILDIKENKGVAHAKNALLLRMLNTGCDALFLLEDDILLLDNRAVTEYIRIGKEYGWDHLMFGLHGTANVGIQHYSDKDLAYYPNCVGAWCYYTRECLEGLKKLEEDKGMVYPGLMDENFKNAWEHVEHTTRLGNAGYTGWFGIFPDIKDSAKYISEIKGSIEGSAIRKDNKEWVRGLRQGLSYWQQKHGSPFPDNEIVVNLPKEE